MIQDDKTEHIIDIGELVKDLSSDKYFATVKNFLDTQKDQYKKIYLKVPGKIEGAVGKDMRDLIFGIGILVDEDTSIILTDERQVRYLETAQFNYSIKEENDLFYVRLKND